MLCAVVPAVGRRFATDDEGTLLCCPTRPKSTTGQHVLRHGRVLWRGTTSARAPSQAYLLKKNIVAFCNWIVSSAVLKLQVPDSRASRYDLADGDHLVVFGVTIIEGGAPFCVLIWGEAKADAVFSKAAIHPCTRLHT